MVRNNRRSGRRWRSGSIADLLVIVQHLISSEKAVRAAKARHALRSDAPAWVPVVLDWFEEMENNAADKIIPQMACGE
jgi:hypothetical protein